MSDTYTKRYYVNGPYGQIHITEAGPVTPTGKPALVCFHQSPVSGAQYALFQAEMAADRRVLCPDTPGFGASDPPPVVPSIADYTTALAAGLENAGLPEDGPFDVLGFHTGTLICVELAATRPDLVRRVVLASLALFTEEERARNRKIFGGPRPLFEDPAYIPNYFKSQVTEGLEGITPERRLELFTARLEAGALSWYGPEAVFTYDTAARLPHVSQPTLLLLLKDTLTENTRRAAALLENPTLKDRPDIHGPSGWDSHPAEIAADVRAFLDGE